MKPDEFKGVALTLMKEISDYKDEMEEGVFRTIIDRYYYFYFLYSRECLEKVNKKVSKSPKAHFEIQKELTKLLTNKKNPNIDKELIALRSKRNDAFYDLDKKFSYEDTQLYISQIDRMVSHIKNEPAIGKKM
jgi:uncharacterized protein (UPF0332 family)